MLLTEGNFGLTLATGSGRVPGEKKRRGDVASRITYLNTRAG